MKTILDFIKTTVTGGLLFLIPLVLIVMVIGKAFRMLRPLLQRGVVSLHVETVLGVAVLTILTGLVLALICFAAGLLIRLDKMKRFKKMTEELILKFVPGFEYLRAIAGQQVTETNHTLRAILLQDGEAWVIAFIVEEDPDGYTTVFIPESPRADSGNTKILLTSSLSYHNLSVREALSCLRHYGGGSLALLNRGLNLKASQPNLKE